MSELAEYIEDDGEIDQLEANVQHAALRPGVASGIHVAQAWEVADEAARLALAVVDEDAGRICRQLDDDSYWLLRDAAPPATWGRVDGALANPAIIAWPSGDHTLAAADASAVLHCTAAGGTPKLIVPANATAPLPVGFTTAVVFDVDTGTALIELAAGVTAVTLNAPLELAPHAGATLQQVAPDHWWLVLGTPIAASGGGGTGPAAPAAAPPPIAASSAMGTPGAYATETHTHAHGDQAGGSLHAAASTSTAGFLSAADKARLDALPGLASSAPANVTKAAAAAGTGTAAARADHKHDVTTAAPVAVGTANAEGSAAALARADHVHAHGDQAGGTLHAVATSGAAGFMSAADKAALDGLAAGGGAPLNASYLTLTGESGLPNERPLSVDPNSGLTLVDNGPGTGAKLGRQPIRYNVTSGSFVLDPQYMAGDCVVYVTYNGNTLIELPAHATYAWPLGTRMRFIKRSTGVCTLRPAVGVTLGQVTFWPDSVDQKLGYWMSWASYDARLEDFGFIDLTKIDTNVWYAFGVFVNGDPGPILERPA